MTLESSCGKGLGGHTLSSFTAACVVVRVVESWLLLPSMVGFPQNSLQLSGEGGTRREQSSPKQAAVAQGSHMGGTVWP